MYANEPEQGFNKPVTRSPLGFVQEHIIENLNDINETSRDYLFRLITSHPHSKEDAYVRKGRDISPEEKEYILERKTIDSTRSKTIALCFSGGGYRAMIATLGFLQGAQESGLLDQVSYISSLSGSTWAISLCAAWQERPEQIIQRIKPLIKQDLLQGFSSTWALYSSFYKKLIYGRKTSIIDFYGELLAHRLLAGLPKERQQLHAQASLLDPKIFPYPIYTSVLLKENRKYAWMEYTPHEVGSTYLDAFIPSWALGRTFSRGISISRTPAEKLSLLLGIWGSAFSANLREIYTHMGHGLSNKILTTCFEKVTDLPTVGQHRLCLAKIRNFTHHMDKSPLGKARHLKLLDAGLVYNLPLPPLLRKERSIDVIIICDASATSCVGEELFKAQAKLHKKCVNFPHFDQNEPLGPCTIKTILDGPTVIYMPLVKNEQYQSNFDPQELCHQGYCKTSNFKYQPEEIDQLAGLMRYNVIQYTPHILAAIKSNH